MNRFWCGLIGFVSALTGLISAAEVPVPAEGDAVLRDFKFRSGETLPELRLHYRTLGKPERDASGRVRNAVLVMHGTSGSGAQFFQPQFATEMFLPGQPLDPAKYFTIMPDGIGHGKSTKPSDGLRAKFPHYGYLDMVEAQYRVLVEALGVNHLRLVMGTSQGGMLTWLWGELHPDFMDALLPLASAPVVIAGRNRAWRRLVIDAVRHDPEWYEGNYAAPPPSMRTVAEMFFLVSSNPVLRQQDAPTLQKADELVETYVADFLKKNDTNDVLYAIEASYDYDPNPALEKIRAPLLAINSADDYVNPPELGILEREIKRVPRGRALVLPLSPATRGHQSHTWAVLWKDEFVKLMKETEQKSP